MNCERQGTPSLVVIDDHPVVDEEVRRMFGDKADEAARIHIEMDLMEEGWTRTDPFPRDERHYVDMGLF